MNNGIENSVDQYFNQITQTTKTVATIEAMILVAIIVLYFVARWKYFTKAGIKGWKALIPFYGTFEEYNTFWNGGFYFLFLILMFLGIFFIYGQVDSWFSNLLSLNFIYTSNFSFDFKYLFIGLLSLLADFVIYGIFTYKKARFFNQYLSFALALFVMPYIYALFLAFDHKCKCEKSWW